MDHVHINEFDFIDLTHTISVHQGYETSGSKKYLDEDDFYWNRKFLKTEIENKTWLLFNKLVCFFPFCWPPSTFAVSLLSILNSFTTKEENMVSYL